MKKKNELISFNELIQKCVSTALTAKKENWVIARYQDEIKRLVHLYDICHLTPITERQWNIISNRMNKATM